MRDQIYDKIAQAQGYKDTKDMLTDLYSTKGMTQGGIANLIGCSLPTVKTLREQHGIEDKLKPSPREVIIPAKFLRRLSCNELAAKYKISKSHAWRLKQKAETKKTANQSLLPDEGV